MNWSSKLHRLDELFQNNLKDSVLNAPFSERIVNYVTFKIYVKNIKKLVKVDAMRLQRRVFVDPV